MLMDKILGAFRAKNSLKIELSQNGLRINGKDIDLPIKIGELEQILGKGRATKTKYNDIYAWDKLGFQVYAKKELANALLVCFKREEYEFSPKEEFAGEITIDSVDAREFYKAHKEERVKFFDGDGGGAIVRSKFSYWFSVEASKIEAIQIEAVTAQKLKYIAKNHIAELPIAVAKILGEDGERAPSVIEPKFSYLKELWEQWIEQINAVVPSDNEYYNLTRGISEETAKNSSLGEAVIPEELINFYKIYNVTYDAVTSAFGFEVEGNEFALIAFDDIKREYDGIMELNDDDEEYQDEPRDERLNLKGYANRAWIPIAHNYSGDYLLYDADPSKRGKYGQILLLENETWVRKVVADSLSELLQKDIELIRSGEAERFEFILEEE